MSEYFPNAPLVELAVEFRWTPDSMAEEPEHLDGRTVLEHHRLLILRRQIAPCAPEGPFTSLGL